MEKKLEDILGGMDLEIGSNNEENLRIVRGKGTEIQKAIKALESAGYTNDASAMESVFGYKTKKANALMVCESFSEKGFLPIFDKDLVPDFS